jgi:hypothetical protein
METVACCSVDSVRMRWIALPIGFEFSTRSPARGCVACNVLLARRKEQNGSSVAFADMTPLAACEQNMLVSERRARRRHACGHPTAQSQKRTRPRSLAFARWQERTLGIRTLTQPIRTAQLRVLNVAAVFARRVWKTNHCASQRCRHPETTDGRKPTADGNRLVTRSDHRECERARLRNKPAAGRARRGERTMQGPIVMPWVFRTHNVVGTSYRGRSGVEAGMRS